MSNTEDQKQLQEIMSKKIKNLSNTWSKTKKEIIEKLKKIELAGKYPDYSKTLRSIKLQDIDIIATLANEVSYTAEIIYELAKYPKKLSVIQSFINEEKYNEAIKNIIILSDSIRKNEEALQNQRIAPAPPLSQIQQSYIGIVNDRTISNIEKSNSKNLRPDYIKWFGRDIWNNLQAACIMNDLDPKFARIAKGYSYSEPIFPEGFQYVKEQFDITNSWTSFEFFNKQGAPLSYINKYLLEGFDISNELFELAKEKFLRNPNNFIFDIEKCPKGFKEMAPQFKELLEINKKSEKKSSIKKEKTLSILVGALIEKYFTSQKYQKTNGHNTSAIADDIINYISEKMSGDSTPHGLKKSNLQEILNTAMRNWKNEKEQNFSNL
jgi:hypothetical protein